MKQGWEIKEFEDCLEKVVYTNKIQRKDFLEDGEYPIISQEQDFINGFWDNSDDLFKVKKPIVIFGDHTQVLKYVDFDFVLGADGVKILQPTNSIDPRFFYYFLQNINLGSLGYARHYRLLKEIEVTYPKPLHEQQSIVAILDEAFAAIAKAKANAEQNLKNAKELFESYLHGVFENKGEGWEEKTLGEVCDFENGDRGKNYPNKSRRVENGIPFINAGHLNDNKIDFSEMDYISEERLKLLGNGKIKPNDILFCLRGSLGKVANVGNLENGAIASSLVIIRVRKELDNDFLLYFLSSNLTTNQIVDFGNGAAQPNLSAGSLKKFIIPLPKSLKEQQTIVQKLDALSTETKKLEAIYQQKLNDLEELKKSVLQKAFSGELVIKNETV
jgi:type I restriction enzyme S subunit